MLSLPTSLLQYIDSQAGVCLRESTSLRSVSTKHSTHRTAPNSINKCRSQHLSCFVREMLFGIACLRLTCMDCSSMGIRLLLLTSMGTNSNHSQGQLMIELIKESPQQPDPVSSNKMPSGTLREGEHNSFRLNLLAAARLAPAKCIGSTLLALWKARLCRI